MNNANNINYTRKILHQYFNLQNIKKQVKEESC